MLLLYGANGYSGELIAREAVRRGLAPVLAGRNAEAVGALGAALGLPTRVFGLDDADALRNGLAGVSAVLHCAGPFVHTSAPMVEGCLAAGAHYLDITGEISVFEAVLKQGARAMERGVVLLPGVGFDVVPTDCLAARLARALPDATHLDLAFVNVGGAWSRGTLSTMIGSLAGPGVRAGAGAVRQDGRIVPVPLAHETMELDLPIGHRTVMTIPWGDVSTAYHSTRIPNIRVFTGAHPGAVRRLRALRPFLPVLGWKPVQRAALAWVRRRVTGPDEAARSAARVYLWGRVRNAEGAEVTATLETPEGYTLTALSAVECLRRVGTGEVAPGAWTPSKAFGADFVATLPGAQVGEVVRQEGSR